MLYGAVPMNRSRIALPALMLLALAACGETAKLPVSAGTDLQ